MSDAILEHGGTVVAYMGDGIMAVFGAPIEQADNPDRALAAAREISGARLDRFNRWLLEGGRGEGFRIGVGLATGPIQSGNVGSEKRLEYAAVGDTTNVAARLEAQTKETPYQLLLAESMERPHQLGPSGPRGRLPPSRDRTEPGARHGLPGSVRAAPMTASAPELEGMPRKRS